MTEGHVVSSGPSTSIERIVLAGLILAGLAFPLLGEMYDSAWATVRLALWLLSILVSFSALRPGLQYLGVQRDRLSPAAVWGLLGWSVVPLSQIPYVGYLLIPIELALGAVLASFRGGISVPKALLAVSLARLLVFAATLAVRSLV
jgi:hypothetical protein